MELDPAECLKDNWKLCQTSALSLQQILIRGQEGRDRGERGATRQRKMSFWMFFVWKLHVSWASFDTLGNLRSFALERKKRQHRTAQAVFLCFLHQNMSWITGSLDEGEVPVFQWTWPQVTDSPWHFSTIQVMKGSSKHDMLHLTKKSGSIRKFISDDKLPLRKIPQNQHPTNTSSIFTLRKYPKRWVFWCR